MIAKNDYIRDFLGITPYINLGYDGSLGLSATGEDFDKTDDTHAVKGQKVFHEIAPNRKRIYVKWDGAGGLESAVVPAVKNLGVDTMSLAIVSSDNANTWDEQLEPIVDKFTFFVAAGNWGTNDFNGRMIPLHTYGIAAAELSWSSTSNGKPTAGATLSFNRVASSSVSEHVDFIFPTSLYLDDGTTFPETSGAVQVAEGTAAIINHFALAKTGKVLSGENMYKLFMHNSSRYKAGLPKSDYEGWGYVILPDPATIDIWRYAPLEIKMKINSKTMTVNGETKVLDQAPIIAPSGRTLAPVRAVFEAAGLTVEWDAATQTITATR